MNNVGNDAKDLSLTGETDKHDVSDTQSFSDVQTQRQQQILHRDSHECRRHSPRLETGIRPAANHQCSGGAQENKVTEVSKEQDVKYKDQESAGRS